ncbi:MAG TPA: glycoside hydrolase family 25 protein [Polyangiaceae bacterium]|jgi:GH25 family lysozyme M1 (1,4-beta-N-acetylmuramidase)
MPIRGIDVSSIQGKIDWPKVAASGVRFVMRKCGNGNNAPDPGFADDVAGARAAGLAVGAYHVGFPLPSAPEHPGRDAADQAKAHFAACKGLGSQAGELPPALDLEWPVPGTPEWAKYGCTPDQVRAWAIAYLEAAETLWGRLPIVYDGFPIYWQQIGGASEPRFGRYPLWVVNYPEQYKGAIPPDGASPPIPGPWSAWTLWQHSGGGQRLPSGAAVDGNVFCGDEEAFAGLLAVGPLNQA